MNRHRGRPAKPLRAIQARMIQELLAHGVPPRKAVEIALTITGDSEAWRKTARQKHKTERAKGHYEDPTSAEFIHLGPADKAAEYMNRFQAILLERKLRALARKK